MSKAFIIEITQKALEKLGLSSVDIALEHPTDLSHGDYATNVAMILAKKAGEDPRALAEKITSQIISALPDTEGFIEKVEVAGPGFINFYLSRKFFSQSIQTILKSDKEWGKGSTYAGKQFFFEYFQPNMFKVLHIGHLVNAIVGEALSRLVEFSGAKVYRATYYSDIGLNIAKALWALKKKESFSTVDELSDAYVEGKIAYEEDETAKSEIDDINKKLYEKSDPELNALYEKGIILSKTHDDGIARRLGSRFDYDLLESDAAVVGIKVVKDALARGILEESQGAVIFPGEKYGLHTRVFLNSKGLPVYETKDIGLVQLKLDKVQADHLVIVTDVEQAEYFKVVVKAVEEIFPELAGKVVHVSHGRLRLPTGRMSSRSGGVIAAESFLNDMQNIILKRIDDKDIADQIAQAAVKYTILKQGIGKSIVFDIERSVSVEGDSGPYLQYTAVRAASVIQKAREAGISPEADTPTADIAAIERLLYRFPEVVGTATKDMGPQYVVQYLTALAGAFNTWYAHEKIIDRESPHSPYRVALTQAVKTVLENGLWLLGITVPERM